MLLFTPALSRMEKTGSAFFGPFSFKKYLIEHGLSQTDTARYVSIDSIEKLPPELRDAGTMIFRLGSREGINETHFGLARCSTDWSDYFLIDEQLMELSDAQAYLPTVTVRRLFAFQLLPKLTETSLVNLAVASGLLQHALGLSADHEQIVPATGQSTFSFPIKPREDLAEPWQHRNGQVEVDALFVGQRDGRETLFLVEAKRADRPSGSLAKHKLAYPLVALRAVVPSYIDIVPVYLKAWAEGDYRHFLVAECTAPDLSPFVITELKTKSVAHLVLRT